MRLFTIWLAAWIAIIAIWQAAGLVTGLDATGIAIMTALSSFALTYPFAWHMMCALEYRLARPAPPKGHQHDTE